MSKRQELEKIIVELRQAVVEINGVMVASLDGLTLATDLPEAEAARVAAMTATAAGLGRRMSETVGLGGIQELVLRGEQGYMMLYRAGEKAVLAVMARGGANLGLINLESRDAAQKIARLMG
jgi:predicted regulator of Ras-like GTPase activity (Roadblock/LC7/MglB family)